MSLLGGGEPVGPADGLDEADLAIVSGQLGRQARDVTGIAVRCPFGRPVVIETSSVLTGGMPNPTLLYLTCPTAVTAISRVESAGGVKRLKSACVDDPELRLVLDAITDAYRQKRATLAGGEDPRPNAGVGGPENPERASCLHAYTAALLAALSGWLRPEIALAEGEGEPRGTALADATEAKERRPVDLADAAEAVWDRLLPPRDTLWCDDDRCARYRASGEGAVPVDEEQEPARGRGGRRVAAIDIGTISVRLLVAEVVGGRPEHIYRQVEVTRLGEGLRPGGRLGEEPARRTAAVARRYIAEARRLGASEIVLAGTSATRDAVDGREFIQALGDETGVTAVVLTGAEEARLAYAGACLDVHGDVVVLDVGGGSTELIRRTPEGDIEAVSLDIGASRATERWLHSDPPRPEEMAAAAEEAAALLRPLGRRFGAVSAGDRAVAGGGADDGGLPRLVGVAGTITTLACLDAEAEVYTPELVHLRRLSRDAVEGLAARLGGMTIADRTALPCVQAGRAAVIVGGALIVKEAMQVLGYPELVVSERDLLDGLVLLGTS